MTPRAPYPPAYVALFRFLAANPGATVADIARALWAETARSRKGSRQSPAERAQSWAQSTLRRLREHGVIYRDTPPHRRGDLSAPADHYYLTPEGGDLIGVVIEVAEEEPEPQAPAPDALPPLTPRPSDAERAVLVRLIGLGGPATPAYLAARTGLTRAEVRDALLSLGRRGEIGIYPGGCVIVRRRRGAERRAA